ncbi:MAG: acetyl ornithine aminotransferase family protein [Chloroflexi bacterium]|nr:MAG: acetyl ornithine aminotransferase family protein [Chloroflexota bacterium]
MNPKRTVPGPRAQAYVARDAAAISPSYTRSYPFVMERGQGAEVWDVDGNRYVDFTAGIAVCSTGHAHPQVVQAIKAQAEKFLHMSGTDFYYPVQIELAEKLNQIVPIEEDTQVFFTNSGTESVEAAIKLARYVTGRPRFIAFIGAFHGRTLGSLAFTASKYVQRQGFFPMMPGVTHVPYPDPYRPVLVHQGDYGEAVVRYIEEVILTTVAPPDEVAAVLVEPIQGEGGYIIPPPGFFPALRDLCDRHGILLIDDEVQAGMGRTGRWFAIEHWGVEPDIVCIAKGIASGLPLGAMVARKRLMTWPPGAHGNTFGGNPVSCAAALATIRLIENGYLENAARMGQLFLDLLAEIAPRHPTIGDVRGKGLMVGVELVQDRETKEPARELRDQVVQEAFRRGLLILGAGKSVIRFMPPLNISRDLVEEGLMIFEEALTAAERQAGLHG